MPDVRLTSLTDDGRVLAAIGMAFVILSTFVSSQTGWPALPFQIVAGVKAAGYMCVGYVLKEWLKAIPLRESGRIVSLRGRSVPDVGVPAVVGIVPDGPALLAASVRGAFLGTFAVIGCASWWGHADAAISAATASSITR